MYVTLNRNVALARDELVYAHAAVRSGLLAPMPPRALVAAGQAVRRYGAFGGLFGASAARFGDRTAVIDEGGAMSFLELDLWSNAVAQSWRAHGLTAGNGVAILARNHRWFLVAVAAAAKTGARIILLNTDFAGPQLRAVAEREGTDLLVHDEEYSALLDGLSPRHGRFLAWTDQPGPNTLAALCAGDATPPPRPAVPSALILLTSGTTGTPKGAARKEPRSLQAVGVLLDRIPFRAAEVTAIPAPMFHTLGLAHTMLAVALGSTILTRRRFDPRLLLADLVEHRATALVAVPVMLRRLLDEDPASLNTSDLSALRIVFVAGSQLGADLARRARAVLGPVLYNLYGSTEVAYATLATPADLDAAPGCVGRPLRGTTVRVLDPGGADVPTGSTGEIFVGNRSQFEGYTDGGGKEIRRGLMSSGDVGHFDCAGRLYIDGRADDMIVSGGENVYPGEVEELLIGHPAIREVAVIGVPDRAHGERLAAFVVPQPDACLEADQVQAYVRANLARFKTPRDVIFLEELPRNPTGKVLKRSLRPLLPTS